MVKMTAPFLEHEIKFFELLKKGKAKVLWKKSGKNLNTIKYKLKKNKSDREFVDFFSDKGIKFYEINIISRDRKHIINQ